MPSRVESESLVRSWGFGHVFTWSDGPNAHYPPHSHSGLTTHLILRGQLTIHFPKDVDPEKKTYGVGDRVDVEGGRVHEVWMGDAGCQYIIGDCDKASTGGGYACADQYPWQVNDTTSYGFAAVHLGEADKSAWCCARYPLDFTSELVQNPLQNRTMVVQAVSVTSSIPGGGLGDTSSCTEQYSTDSIFWGSQSQGFSSVADCDRLPRALKDGCLWRFGWFAGAQNPSVNFEQVTCPAALTAKSGCSRADEQQQLASDPRGPSTSFSPPPPSSPSSKSKESINLIIALAVCVPFLSCVSAMGIYWFCRRRGTNVVNLPKQGVKGLKEEIFPEAQQPELGGRSENADLCTQELSPAYVQEVDTRNVHEFDAVVVGELEINPSVDAVLGSRRGAMIQHDKPLPSLPAEFEGNPVKGRTEQDSRSTSI
ncbi:MAG: hypothetical protein Q9168_001210 [Polycauliona sp. 1 TL-2023]